MIHVASAADLASEIMGTQSPATGATQGLPPVARGWATVQSVQATTLTITLGGSSIPIVGVQYLDSYVPSVGDVVAVDHIDTDILIIGKRGSSTRGGRPQTSMVTGSALTGGSDASTTSATPSAINSSWSASVVVPASGMVSVDAVVWLGVSTSSACDAALYCSVYQPGIGSGAWVGIGDVAFGLTPAYTWLPCVGHGDFTGLVPGGTATFSLGWSVTGAYTLIWPVHGRGAAANGSFIRATTVP